MVTNSKFKFVGGSLCLDFINTVGGWLPAGGKRDYKDRILADKFTSFGDLVEWAHGAGFLSAAEQKSFAAFPGEALLPRAVTFRGSLYHVVKSLLEGWTPPDADLDRLNLEFSAAQSHRRLARSKTAGVTGLTRVWDDPQNPDRTLWTVAESAGDLLTSPEIASVRQCPGDDCGWLFLDTSRNHARRWCQMRICGNRAKIRRFRAE